MGMGGIWKKDGRSETESGGPKDGRKETDASGNEDQRREREASTDRPGVRVHTGSQGGRGMSEVLHEVAEPLLDDLRLPEHRQAFETCLNIAAAVWNASLLEGRRERRKALGKVKKSIRAPGSRRQLEMMIDRTYHRARNLYPEEERSIVGVELVVEPGGRCRINVASVSTGQ